MADITHRNVCSIVGIGATEFSKASSRSELTLAVEAAVAACVDAGLPTSAIDGIVRADYDYVAHNDLVEALGLPNLTYWGVCGPGGIAPSRPIRQTGGAILSGQATPV